jgi:hypothetical protein
VHSWAELSYLTDAVLWPDGWSRAYGVMSLPVFVMQGEVIKACYSEGVARDLPREYKQRSTLMHLFLRGGSHFFS